MILIGRAIRAAPGLHTRRIWAVARKELREYRRNRSVLVAIAIFPLIFLIQPLVALFLAPGASSGALRNGNELLYLLGIPILVPASLAAHAITGERQQGSLEPVLTTPITREEFILGKGLAVLLPSFVIAYAVYGVFLVVVAIGAHPAVAAAVFQGQDLIVQLVYTPLLAAATTWIGLAISTRTNDARVAQQLSILASLPLLVGSTALAFDVIHVTPALLVVIGVILAAADLQGWRIVVPMFDRERLITGTRT